MIEITAVVFDGKKTESMIKRSGAINPDHITTFYTVDKIADIPIIGENNKQTLTVIELVTKTTVYAMETVEELLDLIDNQ